MLPQEFFIRLEKALEDYIPRVSSYSGTVNEAMRYSLLGGGKRIRPQLVALFAQLCGQNPLQVVPFACAVEMVHTYSLIHDDLPCMDDDALRRGKPSNHIVYGEAMALLAGDALLTKAFAVLCCPQTVQMLGPQACATACGVLAQRAGEAGMVGGQVIDLQTEHKQVGLDVLEQMDAGKTVALISAACEMGCVAAGADGCCLEGARAYARGIGLAFQIRDDILDVISDAKTLGKNVGVDLQNARCNYVTLLGVEKAQKLVEQYTRQAIDALRVFGGDTTELRMLAMQLAERKS